MTVERRVDAFIVSRSLLDEGGKRSCFFRSIMLPHEDASVFNNPGDGVLGKMNRGDWI